MFPMNVAFMIDLCSSRIPLRCTTTGRSDVSIITVHVRTFILLFKFSCIYFERGRERLCVRARQGRERGRERESQAGSALSEQSPMWGLNSPTKRS